MDSVFPGLEAAHNPHPMFVHFPIVLWAVALLFWAIGAFHRRDDLFATGTWIGMLGVAAALITLGTGYLAADGLGHDSPGHDLVHAHRDLMVVVTLVMSAIIGVAWFVRRRYTRILRWCLVAALTAAYALTAIGADRGALLVYGYRMGTSDQLPAGVATEHHHGDQPGHHDDHESAPHEHEPEGQPSGGGHDHGSGHDDHGEAL